MATRNWTAAQKQAIDAAGGSVLVSAAAGSGKTAVLVERLIRLITDPVAGCDVDKLLVVTFSNAAASEMRQRIHQALSALLGEDPGNEHLRRQKILMNKSRISTIHAFCLHLIREHFSQLGIQQDFRLLDEAERRVLQEDCARQAVSDFYEGAEENDFYALADLMSTGRDDRRLIQAIMDLYAFIRSHPFPERWLAEKEALYDPAVPVERSPFGQLVLSYVRDALTYAKGLLTKALGLIAQTEATQNAYGDVFASDLAQVERLLAATTYDGVYEGLQGFTFGRLGALRKFEDAELKNAITSLRDEVKKIVSDLRDRRLPVDAAAYGEDTAFLAPMVHSLFEVTRHYGQMFDAAKREQNTADFSDVEHFTLALLVQPEGDGYRRTPLAEKLSAEYAEILIDEYQDTNEAQDMIFRALSKGEENLFMVGDVKQSIYRFRQAMPELFMEKKKRFSPYDGVHFPAKISLSMNFRSKDQVTGGVNFLFSQLMSEEMGEISYDKEEALVPTASNCGCPEGAFSLLLTESDLEEEGVDKLTLEATRIGQEIRRQMESGLIVEGEKSRAPAYRDFCILLRSPKNKAGLYAKVLGEMGIPTYADTGEGFLASKEVSLMFSLLNVIDNGTLEIPLTAVLLSPLFGFTPDELAKIRLCKREGGFASALAVYAGEDAKAAAFLKTIQRYRRYAAVMKSHELIGKIYEETGILSIVQASDDSDLRRTNLLLLREYAKSYEEGGRRGLSGFVGFVSRMAEKGLDFESANPMSESANVVRIMSIHRSKGLEFPICFLADSAKGFNKEDLNRTTLLHSRLGFSCVRRDVETGRQYDTLQQQALKLAIEGGTLSEELRVLYVALTRAKQRMVIMVTGKNLAGKLQKLGGRITSAPAVDPFAVRGAASYADWALLAFLRHPDGALLRQLAGVGEEMVAPAEAALTVSFEKASFKREEPEEEPPAQVDASVLSILEGRFAYCYPHAAETTIPTKLSVSEITHGADHTYSFQKVPAFLQKSEMTGAQKGKALHKFMQFADLTAAKEDLEGEIDRLVEKRFIAEKEGQVIDRRKVQAFLSSRLYKEMQSASQVLREYRFMLTVPASQVLGEGAGGSPVTVQGEIDCILLEEGGATIVDYKTDHVKEGAELLERYATQLYLYRQAVEHHFGVPVHRLLIYSLGLSKEVEVPLSPKK